MANKVLTEARSICPELKPAIRLLDDLAYTRQYSKVFEDFVNWCVFQFSYPPSESDPLAKKYKEQEQAAFLDIYKHIQTEVRQRTSLWLKDGMGAWYDPLGRIYECIVSKNKSSRMGQYFTPEHVVDMMVKMMINDQREGLQTVCDPACGSGRMGLSAAAQLMQSKTPVWVTMNDIDTILTKVTAINMCLNGVVGEVTNMNGLDLTGDTYRFGYRISPILTKFPKDQWQFVRMALYAKTGEDIRKQYIMEAITYEETYLSQVNQQTLQDLKERQKRDAKAAQQAKIQALQTTIQQRMKGTLFEGETISTDELILPKKQTKKGRGKAPKKSIGDGQQGNLFE